MMVMMITSSSSVKPAQFFFRLSKISPHHTFALPKGMFAGISE
jgi:hypothetical protein